MHKISRGKTKLKRKATKVKSNLLGLRLKENLCLFEQVDYEDY